MKQAHQPLPTKLLENLIQIASTGIVVTDATLPDNPIIFANQPFYDMTGYGPDETIGFNCRFLQGGERKQREVDVVRQAVRNAEHCKVVLRNYRKDGTEFWNELYISPYFDECNNLVNFIGIQHDVTQEVNQRLEKELFNAGLIHDIKSPLMGQSRILEYLSKQTQTQGLSLDGVHDVMLLTLKKSMSRVSDTLNYFKLENELVVPELSRLSAKQLIVSVVDELKAQAQEKRLSIQILQPDGDHFFLADWAMSTRALRNLVENAISYSQPGKDIWILSSSNSSMTMLAVIDQGSGLPAPLKQQLTGGLAVVRSSYTNSASSSLGLMTCAQIMRTHGGRLDVIKSDAFGTELALIFPQAEKPIFSISAKSSAASA